MTMQKVKETGKEIVLPAFVRHWLPVLVVGIPLFMRIGAFEEKVNANIAEDRDHHRDTRLHMPYEEKVRAFVTRTEWQKIEDEFDKIDERQRNILLAISRMESQSRTKGVSQ